MIDRITLEVIKNAFDSLADQMAIALMRSAYSAIVRDSVDYSTGFCDAHGRLLAQGLTTPLHLGSFPAAMRHLVRTYEGRMHPGDIFISNDPYGAEGVHLPDIYVIKPIFFGGEVVGFGTTLAHHTDVGGIAPGSNSIHSTEIYQEGLRIPLLKLYDRGEPNDTMFRLIEQNVRVPIKVLGDIRAQVGACAAAERAYEPLLARYGATMLTQYHEALLNDAEARMRAAIAAVPDGEYSFTDYIDGLGDRPEPIVFRVKVAIRGERMTIDWTGSSPQVKAGINSPMPFTRSAAYVAVRCAIAPDVPNSEGYMRPIEVTAPPGTIMNPRLPGACAARGITGYRMIDAVLGALAQAVPERVPGAGEGGSSLPSIGGYVDGQPFVHVETILGTWGGRPHADGEEGVPNPGANQSNQPIEMIEAELPLEAIQYALRPDSGGPGRFRGGLGLIREYRLLAEEAGWTMRSDRRDHPPYGVQGGQPGAPSSNVLNGSTLLPPLPMESIGLRRGDTVRMALAGGGGYGDPFARDPARVLEDWLDEKVTLEHAREAYGVVIDAVALRVDERATAALQAGRTPC